MNLRDLHYFCAVVEHKHFSKAAEACFASQPTLSMQIKKLEEELGVRLIERNNKSVLITKIGHEVYRYAQTILQQAKEIKKCAQAHQDPFSGEVRLGAIPTLAPYLLPRIIPALKKEFPHIQFFLVEEKTESLVKHLRSGKIDVALLALPHEIEDFASTPLFQEEFLLAVSPTHALAKCKSIEPTEIHDQELLLLDEGHCLRQQSLQFCNEHQLSETRHFRGSSLETLRQMVAQDVGITLMPQLAVSHSDYQEVIYIPFKKEPPSREIGLVWRKISSREMLWQKIAEHIQPILEKIK